MQGRPLPWGRDIIGQRLGPPLITVVTSGRASGVKFCQNKFVTDPYTNISSHNARAYPVSDACQYPPTAWRNRQGVPREPRPRLKKLVEKEMRVGTWNVGTMTGKGRELMKVCKNDKHHLGICPTGWRERSQ